MPPREFYIDRIRTVLTASVVFFHCAITYGSIGAWFYYEVRPSDTFSSLLLSLFLVTQQAYFMGLFFFLAGYFTPGSLQRKGYRRFLVDRGVRLGIPLLLFGVLLGPFTLAMSAGATGGNFWGTIAGLWRSREFLNGPLWFAQALLIFSLAYCAWKAVFEGRSGKVEPRVRPLPGHLFWFLSAICIGAAGFAIRLYYPIGRSWFGLQLGYFPGYIFLFCAGIAAGRRRWIEQLTWRKARIWLLVSILVWPTLHYGVKYASEVLGAAELNFAGGWHWSSLLYAYWEPFVAWGVIATILVAFLRWMNSPSMVWQWLGRRAYAVYVIHPPVLVAVALLLRFWVAPPLAKFAGVGLLACVACWLVADPLVRLPGLRRIF